MESSALDNPPPVSGPVLVEPPESIDAKLASDSLELPPACVDVGGGGVELVPATGDRVMVMKEPWLGLVLSGKKTMEIRGQRAQKGLVWLGRGGQVFGRVNITGVLVMDEEEFRKHGHAHMWPKDMPVPYERLCGLILAEPHRLATPVEYYRPGHAIGWNKFRASKEDLPTTQRKQSTTTKRQQREEAEGKPGTNSRGTGRKFKPC